MSLTSSSVMAGGGIASAGLATRSDSAHRTGRPRTPRSDSARTEADGSVAVVELVAPEPSRTAPRALAPAGTDPEIWRALSADERAFFARTPRSDAPVYGRRSGAPTASAPARRGLHLDLRA